MPRLVEEEGNAVQKDEDGGKAERVRLHRGGDVTPDQMRDGVPQSSAWAG